jgi:hypothetical protein
MRLEDLTKLSAELRDQLSKIIVNDPQYLRTLGDRSCFFTSQELNEIDKQHQEQGLTFKQIQEVLAKKGMVVKPPTFKKYVGMKLVSGTRNIQKTERGSVGFYPMDVVRQINLIKYLLESKRDFLDCFITALGATPCNALEIVRSSDPDALDLSENLGDFKADTLVEKHLEDLLSQKLITRADKENVLSKARDFKSACDNVFHTSWALQDALENLRVPGSYRVDKLFETIKKRIPFENKESQESD